MLWTQPCGLEPGKRWDERPCKHCCEATAGRHGGRPGSGVAPALLSGSRRMRGRGLFLPRRLGGWKVSAVPPLWGWVGGVSTGRCP